MSMSLNTIDRCTCGLRVLVVDDEPRRQRDHADLLKHWGYVPIIAEGIGEELIDDAIAKAQHYRCQVALVDMRLYPENTSDISGLKLVPRLKPTVSIILSAFPDWEVIEVAREYYGAAGFIGKSARPEQIRNKIEEVTQKGGLCGKHRPHIVWRDGLSSSRVCDLLFRGREDVQNIPENQVDDAVGRVFQHARRVVLSQITDDHDTSNPISALRRQSIVFKARVDDQPATHVVKIARTDKITREVRNFTKFVEQGLAGNFRPEKVGETFLWDMGAVVYRYVGLTNGSTNGARTFRAYYGDCSNADQVLSPLHHFFSSENWGRWYGGEVTLFGGSLFDAYDAGWNNHLRDAMVQAQWNRHPTKRSFPNLPVALTNPTRWLADHLDACLDLDQPRQSVTHGDLHGDNLFATAYYAFSIDFERTGPGPILRDFVELIQDILTRLAHFTERDTLVLYDLAVAICEPHAPNELMRMTKRIYEHPEARKAFEVVQELQQIMYNLTRYHDRQEYLWGLLLNNLFVVTRLDEDHPRYAQSLLLAAVICTKLDRGNRLWPPPEWPPVEPIDLNTSPREGHKALDNISRPEPPTPQPEASRSRFAHGHALLIGVGGDLPVTVDDARVLYQVLTDPRRCAYTPEHVALLTGAQANRTAILAELDRLALAAHDDPQATIIVYFSGHGVATPTSYLLAHGWELSQLPTTAVSGTELTDRLRAIDARKLLVLLDCCHAGAIGETKQGGLVKTPLPPELEALLPGSGRVVIASSRASEVSFTGRPYSVFTRALVEGLLGRGAAQADGYAYVGDIAMHVSHTVVARTQDKQHPVLKLEGADNFAVAYYAGGAKEPLDDELP